MLVWTLLLALAVQGYAGVLVQLLGPMHRHDPGTAAVAGVGEQLHAWLDALQAWQRDLRARSVAPGLLGHGGATHSHGLFERHHHAHGDATVVALDGGAAGDAVEDASAAAAGSLTAPSGPAARLILPAATTQAGWARPASARPWRDAAARRPERPPPA
ncbi:MAG: hypothetical protein JNL87_15045 [Burkholderiaceae bacterium]|nr:hypothetical protein [Burkholderiaceae bacterium]